jgi:O-antigen/teichoic acid export membrane protein
MKNKYRDLSKNVLLFSLNGFVPKILSFFLIPIYTGYLSTMEYGVSDLILTTVSLLVPIFTLDIQDAVMRFALDKSYDKGDVFSVGFRIVLKGSIIVALGALIISQFHIAGLRNEYLFFTVVLYIVTASNSVFSLFCRGIDQVKVIAVSSIINSVIMLTSNILFLIYFHWGLMGYLVANSLGAICSLLYMFLKARLYQYIHIHISKDIAHNMYVFSFPLIFSVIGWWINNASDRYILSWMSGIAVSGIYAVSYKIPNILSMFQNVFAQAWSISAIKEFDPNDTDGFIGKTYTSMNFGMVFFCSCIMIMNIPIATFLYSNDFFEAWKYVPPLLVSVVFNAMALFIGSIFTAIKDTKTLSISTIVGATVNTICNFIFIYFWGAYGAAIATLLGYGVTLVMRHKVLRKYIQMKVHWKRDIVGYVLLLIQMIVSMFGWNYIAIQVLILILIILQYKKETQTIIFLLKNGIKTLFQK